MELVTRFACPRCGEPVDVVTMGASDLAPCPSCGTELLWTRQDGLKIYGRQEP